MLRLRLALACRQLYDSLQRCAAHPQAARLLSLSCRALLTNACSCRITERTVLRRMLDRFGHVHRHRLRRGGQILMGSCLFAFEYRVTDEEVEECLQECSLVRGEINELKDSQQQQQPQQQQQAPGRPDSWSLVVNRHNVVVWRKPLGSVFEYRIFGSYDDISPKDFFAVLDDLEYRREWDDFVLELQYLSRDRGSNTDLIRWVAHYPRPMRPREYIYKRRWHHDQQSGAIVVINRSVAGEFGDLELRSDTVRVKEYKSDMVIWPHAGLEDNGFDYVLTYYDNPQSSIPCFAYNWVASSGLPDFMSKLHQVTKQRRPTAFQQQQQQQQQQQPLYS